MLTYDPMAGERIEDTCRQMVLLATGHGESVHAEFNGIPLVAKPGADAEHIRVAYNQESDRRRAEYLASPEYKRAKEESERRLAEQRAALNKGLSTAPAIELANPKVWEEFVANNSDPYGWRVAKYAEDWARLMQARIAAGESVEDCAEPTSNLADDDGITGFMYGCAVRVLAGTWKHGEALRRWHNLKTQLGNEGEAANENGGVLNPAVMKLG